MVTQINGYNDVQLVHNEEVDLESEALKLRNILHRLSEVERDSTEYAELINELADKLARQVKIAPNQRITQLEQSTKASRALVKGAMLVEKALVFADANIDILTISSIMEELQAALMVTRTLDAASQGIMMGFTAYAYYRQAQEIEQLEEKMAEYDAVQTDPDSSPEERAHAQVLIQRLEKHLAQLHDKHAKLLRAGVVQGVSFISSGAFTASQFCQYFQAFTGTGAQVASGVLGGVSAGTSAILFFYRIHQLCVANQEYSTIQLQIDELREQEEAATDYSVKVMLTLKIDALEHQKTDIMYNIAVTLTSAVGTASIGGSGLISVGVATGIVGATGLVTSVGLPVLGGLAVAAGIGSTGGLVGKAVYDNRKVIHNWSELVGPKLKKRQLMKAMDAAVRVHQMALLKLEALKEEPISHKNELKELFKGMKELQKIGPRNEAEEAHLAVIHQVVQRHQKELGVLLDRISNAKLEVNENRLRMQQIYADLQRVNAEIAELEEKGKILGYHKQLAAISERELGQMYDLLGEAVQDAQQERAMRKILTQQGIAIEGKLNRDAVFDYIFQKAR